MELVFVFRDGRFVYGDVDPQSFNYGKLKAEAVTKTSHFGFDSEKKIQTVVINPQSKVKVLIDSDFALKYDSVLVILFNVGLQFPTGQSSQNNIQNLECDDNDGDSVDELSECSDRGGGGLCRPPKQGNQSCETSTSTRRKRTNNKPCSQASQVQLNQF